MPLCVTSQCLVEAPVSTVSLQKMKELAKTWFNPFIVRDDMIQNSVVAKLNKGLFPTELERTSIFTGLYDECAKVS